MAETPLTFDVHQQLLSRLEQLRRELGNPPMSLLVREAIARYPVSSYKSDRQPHKQLSVRVPPQHKETLARAAASKGVSVGEILRAALEQLLQQPPASLGENRIEKAMARKTAAKKTARKTTKKVAAKKSTAKKATKKVAKKATKKTARKVTAKKATKKAAKKATKKAAKKATKKVAKKASKKVTKKATKKTARKRAR